MERIKEIAARIKMWQKQGYAHPYKLDIFLTNRCNLKCRFCQFPLLDKESYHHELTKAKLLQIIEDAAKLDIKIIGILGGEPFVRNDAIIDVMTLIKKRDIDGSLVTNGTLLSDKQMKEIIYMKWNLIRFSIDGSTEKIHDSLRGVKSFKKIISNLKKFQESKQQLGEQYPVIEINTVLCRKNTNDLSEIIKLALDFHVKSIYFLPMIEFTNNIDDIKIKEKDIPSLLNNISLAKKLSKKYAITTNLNQIEHDSLYSKSNKMDTVILENKKQKNFIPCYLPWYGLNIDGRGIVTPCAATSGNKEIYCGNVNDFSLDTIWTNNYFKNLRKKMKKKQLPEICSQCCVPLLDENNQIRVTLNLR